MEIWPGEEAVQRGQFYLSSDSMVGKPPGYLNFPQTHFFTMKKYQYVQRTFYKRQTFLAV